MIFVYLPLVLLLVACVWTVAKALEQPPRHTPAHRGERRRRPSGDRLTDLSYDRDEDAEEWLRAMRDPQTPTEHEKSRIGAARILRAIEEET